MKPPAAGLVRKLSQTAPANDGRDAGVDGVAALLEHACARTGGQRMTRGDGALHGAKPRAATN